MWMIDHHRDPKFNIWTIKISLQHKLFTNHIHYDSYSPSNMNWYFNTKVLFFRCLDSRFLCSLAVTKMRETKVQLIFL